MNGPSFRLLYFANVRFPSERANSIQIASMCSAFAGLGGAVTLLHPWRFKRFNPEPGATIFEHYGLKERFGLKQLFSLDCIDLLPRRAQGPAFRLQAFSFGLRSILRMRKEGPNAWIYLRDNALAALSSGLLADPVRRRIFYEAHDFPENPRNARILARAASRLGGVVAITRGLAERFAEQGVDRKTIKVAPDGVDLARFESPLKREKARRALSLPLDRRLALYAGQLFPWKGVENAVEAVRHGEGWDLVIVGGVPADRERLRNLARRAAVETRVRFRDPVPPARVPEYLWAADLLLLPNSARTAISAHYTSPMKLFEYMASGRPVVASDLPSLGEILHHEENALLVRPDDPKELAAAINRLLTDHRLGDRLASNASREAARYGWPGRALEILKFMNALYGGTG